MVETDEKKLKRRKIIKRIIIPVICVVAAAAVFFCGFMTSRLTLRKELEEIDYIIGMYRKYYYDEKEDVVGIFAKSLLDQYSAYYTKEEYDAITKADAGRREGIGISFLSDLTIVSVFGNSPAQNAGLIEGGVIKAVKYSSEEEYRAVSTSSEFVDTLNAMDAYVDIDFSVDYGGEIKTFTMQKKEYRQTYVTYADDSGKYGFSDADGEMEFIKLSDSDITGDVGYIKYTAFSGTGNGLYGSEGQFKKAMETFKGNGKHKIILDLRDNGGGFIDIMQDVLKYFVGVENGKKVPVTICRDKYGKEVVYNSKASEYDDYGFEKIVILVNSGSASASEAFVGAVLDYDARNVVSVVVEGYEYGGATYYTTYGKGIMQTTFIRLNGGAIKLTTAKLFWPQSDVCIHDKGITTALNEVFCGRIVNESGKGKAYEDALALCR